MQPLPHQRISSNTVISSMLPDLQRNKLDLSTLIGLFEHFPLGIVICESRNRCLYRNPAYQRMMGLDTKDRSMTDNWYQQITDMQNKDFNTSWQQHLNGLKELHLDVQMQRDDGQIFCTRILGASFPLADERHISIFMFEDISERLLVRNALLVAQQQLYIEKIRSQVALDSIGDAVITVNLESQIIYLNSEAEMMTGWSRNNAMGMSLPEVFRIMDADSGTSATCPVREAMQHNHKMELQHGHLLISREGEEIAIEDSASPVHDQQGTVIGAVLVFHHVVKSRAMLSRMTELAWHDFLTGLPNFALFTERLEQTLAMAERHHRRMAVLFVDLDGFKRVNDTQGHLWGDLLLKSVADKLQSCVRHTDTVCRRSGDEFLILLGEIEHPEDAIQVTEQILASISQTDLNGVSVNLTASIGISVFPDECREFDKLLEHSDNAMYEAKRQGKNRYFYAGSSARM